MFGLRNDYNTLSVSSPSAWSIFILLASILWGTTGAAATLVPEVSPLAIGAFSMGVGGMIQTLLAHTALKKDASLLKQHRKEVVIGALA